MHAACDVKHQVDPMPIETYLQCWPVICWSVLVDLLYINFHLCMVFYSVLLLSYVYVFVRFIFGPELASADRYAVQIRLSVTLCLFVWYGMVW